jgi:hypothetical protein
MMAVMAATARVHSAAGFRLMIPAIPGMENIEI